jgi:hypothetical protein
VSINRFPAQHGSSMEAEQRVERNPLVGEGIGIVTNTLYLEPVILGRTWHYHLFVPADDQRYMRCIWPGCDVARRTCAHHYQNYGPFYKCCPSCQEVRRIETGGLFGKAQVKQPIGGDAEEDKER